MITTTEALSSNPDLDLAQRHRYGDGQAFEEIYSQYSPMVYNLAWRMAGNAELAEDLAQDIFIRIYRFLGRFNGQSTLKTWIYRISLNQCRSRLGRRQLPTEPLKDEHGDEGVDLADQRRSPEQETLARDTGRRVAAALRQLKPIFREAVVLRDLEGLTYDEIAAVLKIRIGTVRSRIARGRDQLRIILESQS